MNGTLNRHKLAATLRCFNRLKIVGITIYFDKLLSENGILGCPFISSFITIEKYNFRVVICLKFKPRNYNLLFNVIMDF